MGGNLKEDPTFFDRADGFISLANGHAASVERGKVSASLMYASARFQAWNAATWSGSAEEMKAKRDETVKYFLQQYQAMLEENLDDHIQNHAKYMKADG